MKKRYFKIKYPDDGVEVFAELLDEVAPKTCNGFWDMLEKPVKNEVLHGTFLGRANCTRYSFTDEEIRRAFKRGPIPRENLTSLPAPGDILFVWWDETTGRSRGFKPPFYGLDMFYGPDSHMFPPMGWIAGTNFARIRGWETDPPTENFEKFVKVARSVLIEGAKKIILSRTGDNPIHFLYK